MGRTARDSSTTCRARSTRPQNSRDQGPTTQTPRFQQPRGARSPIADKNLPETANNLLGAAGSALGRLLARHAHVPDAVRPHRQAAAHAAALGPDAAGPAARIDRTLDEVNPYDLVLADRQHRHLDHRRHRGRRRRRDRRRAVARRARADRRASSTSSRRSARRSPPIIVVTFTLIAAGPTAAAIMLAVILVYQQAENYLIQPAVMRQAVELSGFATIASVMSAARCSASSARSSPCPWPPPSRSWCAR